MEFSVMWVRLLFALVVFGAIALVEPSIAQDGSKAKTIGESFSSPTPVTIEGYTGHSMEPFLSRDGKLLFFNSRNMPTDQTDIHVAAFVDKNTFRYIGPVKGANSESLDGVPSLDRFGRFYFISTRAYEKTGNTLWSAEWRNASIHNPTALNTNFTPKKLLRLNIDMEITADGKMLYVAENRWDLFRGVPATSDLAIAQRNSGQFERLPNSDKLMAAINSKMLEFAPSISADQLTLYFTRLNMKLLRKGKPDAFAIMVSARENRDAAWSPPAVITALSGHIEGPTVTPDGCAIYFHQLVAETFGIMRSERMNCSKGSAD
jgi:WD40-like Beta Propeller Repeat